MDRRNLQITGTHLSKAILLRDAFTEETVTGGVQIRVPGQGKKPVGKPGGYWLFMDMGQGEFEIEITSAIYQSRRVCLIPDSEEEAEEIFLYPSRCYPRRAGMLMAEGTADAGMVLHFHLEKDMPECRLIQDCKKGDNELSMFRKDSVGARRKWYIRDKGKQTGEYLIVRESEEELQRCRLHAPLKYSYRKKDTAIYPAYACIADEEGKFCLLLPRPENIECRLYYSYTENGKEFSGEIEMKEKKRLQKTEEGLQWECV